MADSGSSQVGGALAQPPPGLGGDWALRWRMGQRILGRALLYLALSVLTIILVAPAGLDGERVVQAGGVCF